MTRKSRSVATHRRGKLAILFAVLLPVLAGIIALSVDTAVVATARSQLQATADSAALAGAMKIAAIRTPSLMNTMMSGVRSKAQAIAYENRILTKAPVILDNATNAASGEIVVGYLSRSDTTSLAPSTTGLPSRFNSVQVRLHRDSSHAGDVPLFFGGVLGRRSTTMQVTSVATLVNAKVKGFSSGNGQPANLLPIVLDTDTYQAMLAGTTTDQYSWDDIAKTVSAGADGTTESKLYPVKNGNPGNWGTINVGVTNNSTSTLGAQIRYGITPQQLATFPNGRIELNSALSPPSINFSGNPGISAGIKDDLASIIGRPVFIPIYDQTGGNGNNAWYRVIKFAGVRIVSVNFQGNPKYVIIQPALVNDPTAIPGDSEAELDDGGLVRVYLAR
jgi:Flp pilus assembly protein TadG